MYQHILHLTPAILEGKEQSHDDTAGPTKAVRSCRICMFAGAKSVLCVPISQQALGRKQGREDEQIAASQVYKVMKLGLPNTTATTAGGLA